MCVKDPEHHAVAKGKAQQFPSVTLLDAASASGRGVNVDADDESIMICNDGQVISPSW